MLLSEEFAAFNLRFAQRVSQVTGLELIEALRQWTPAGRQAAADCSELGSAPDARRLWRAYQTGPIARTRPRFGSFYQMPTADARVLWLHFANVEGRVCSRRVASRCGAASRLQCSPTRGQPPPARSCCGAARGCTT